MCVFVNPENKDKQKVDNKEIYLIFHIMNFILIFHILNLLNFSFTMEPSIVILRKSYCYLWTDYSYDFRIRLLASTHNRSLGSKGPVHCLEQSNS